MKILLFNNILTGLSDLFYPRICEGCQRALHKDEAILCLHCNLKLPRTYFHSQPENKAAQIFMGRLPFNNVSAFVYFTKDGMAQHLLHAFKYKKKLEIGRKIGTLFATDLQDCKWINTIDVIVPVPLHKKKERLRGFNQAETLARSMGAVLNIPIKTDWLERVTATVSQTKKSRLARLENVREAFAARTDHILEHTHILLVDDVLTTGATLEACALELLKIKGVKVSIVAIALATD